MCHHHPPSCLGIVEKMPHGTPAPLVLFPLCQVANGFGDALGMLCTNLLSACIFQQIQCAHGWKCGHCNSQTTRTFSVPQNQALASCITTANKVLTLHGHSAVLFLFGCLVAKHLDKAWLKEWMSPCCPSTVATDFQCDKGGFSR